MQQNPTTACGGPPPRSGRIFALLGLLFGLGLGRTLGRRSDVVGAFGRRFGGLASRSLGWSATASSAGASPVSGSRRLPPRRPRLRRQLLRRPALRPEVGFGRRCSSATSSVSALPRAAESARQPLPRRRRLPRSARRWLPRPRRRSRPRPLPAALRQRARPSGHWRLLPLRRPSSHAASTRSLAFSPGSAFFGLLRAARSRMPAASRKRRTRSDGCAPTASQCEMRSASSFTRSGKSFASKGL